MKNFNLAIFLLFTFLMMTTSCTQRVVDFTIISTKNVDLSQAGTFERGRVRNTGTDRVYWILSIPLGAPSMKEAIDKAIERTPGAVALVDGVVYSKAIWFVLSGFSEYIVEGTPLVNPALGIKNTDLESDYNWAIYNENNEVEQIIPLTQEEYESKKKKMFKKATKAK